MLAGILDTYGGLRFVVTYREALRHHARHDETTIIVRNLVVHEPVSWNAIPWVVARIERAVEEQWIARGLPNEPSAREAYVMYRLRQLEGPTKRSLDINSIVTT